MSVYTATMMKAEPLIRSSKERSPLQGDDIMDDIDNPNLYSDYHQGLDVIETLNPDNEVNAALFGYLKIMSDEKPGNEILYW